MSVKGIFNMIRMLLSIFLCRRCGELTSVLVSLFSFNIVALREYFSQFGVVERSRVLFVRNPN